MQFNLNIKSLECGQNINMGSERDIDIELRATFFLENVEFLRLATKRITH